MRHPSFQSHDQKKSGQQEVQPGVGIVSRDQSVKLTRSRDQQTGTKRDRIGKSICFRFINIRFVVGYGNECEFVIFL